VTAPRRLAKLEGALSPKAATLLWLEEAHRFGSLLAYVRWLMDQPLSAAPLMRVPGQAEAGVMRALRGATHASSEAAARKAVRQAIFLVELVLGLNEAAGETTRIGSLRFAISFWEMRTVTLEAQLEADRKLARFPGTATERVQRWHADVLALLTDLFVAEEARGLLEHRYLDGHPALFPDAAQDHLSLRGQVEGLTALGAGILETLEYRGREHPARSPPRVDLDGLRAAAQAGAPDLAAQVADAARCASLDVLGDHQGAAAIVERRLRLPVAPNDSIPED
jgi:hypothetical protein